MRIKKIGQLNRTDGSWEGYSGVFTVSGVIPKNVADVLIEQPETEDSALVRLPVGIGKGYAMRNVMLETIVPDRLIEAQLANPVSLIFGESFRLKDGEYFGVLLFHDQVFLVTTDYVDGTSGEEAVLLIKKQVYSEDNRLKRLRQEIETMERVATGSRFVRTAIPEGIKLLVFARDEGKCVRCGSREKLHFDHVIPVAKGGGNSEANIQLLCDYCNLQKSDKIAF